tara:strand:+ start:405 stop:845 length:441 start_codon:yes stop_codon:yes gene_type:complete
MAHGTRCFSLYAAKSVFLLMFSGLADLGMRRTPLQALGFYLVYSIGLLVITALVGSLVGFIAALFLGDVAIAVNKAMTTVGAIAAIALCGALSTAIARQKKLLSGINLVLVVLSWTGASLGVFIGMAPVAILTAIRAESGATDPAA